MPTDRGGRRLVVPFFSESCSQREGTRTVTGAFLLLAILVASSNSVAAQTSDWKILGADRLDSTLLSSLGTDSSADSIAGLIRRWYFSEGYFSVRVRTTGPDTLQVREGDRYRIEQILVNDAPISPGAGAPVGDYYSDSALSGFVSDRLSSLEAEGYLVAAISIDRVAPDTSRNSIRIELSLDSGERFRVGEVDFRGAAGTSRSFLQRVADIGSDRVYDPERIERARERLYRTGLFDRPDYPEIRLLDSGRVGLRFTLHPRSVNSFDGAVGYQPSGGNDPDGFFTGSVDIVLRNIFGGGERIAGSWSKIDESTSDLSLGYGSPYLFGLPFGLDVQFTQRVEEETPAYTSWLERTVQGLATLEVGGEWRLEAGLGASAVIPSPDTLAGPCSDRLLPRSSTVSILLGIGYDTRDFPLNPRNGTVYRSRFGVGRRDVSAVGEGCDSLTAEVNDNARQTLEVELSHFRTVSWPLVLAGRLHGRLLVGEGVDQSELYRVGGFNSVRGYRSGAFRGTRTGVASLEGRVLLSEYSHVGVFLDAGYVMVPGQLSGSGTDRHETLLGYGATFQVDTPAGVARFSVGLAEGAAVEDATISVGLVGSF